MKRYRTAAARGPGRLGGGQNRWRQAQQAVIEPTSARQFHLGQVQHPPGPHSAERLTRPGYLR